MAIPGQIMKNLMASFVLMLLKFPGGNAEVNRVPTQLACECYMSRSITFSYSLSSSSRQTFSVVVMILHVLAAFPQLGTGAS